METIVTCPLGHKCEKTVEGNKLERCAWYVEIAGLHPQTGEETREWQCSLSWLPVLLVENARTNRGQTAALESFRNEMVAGGGQFMKLLALAAGPANQEALDALDSGAN